MSPISYLIELRIRIAQHLLRETDTKAGEIAQQLGMEANYFARLFRKHTGVEPTTYRHEHQTEALMIPWTA